MQDTTRNAKRRRASKPKVRTGCTACKERRVKCDETKPKCYRCEEYGAFCEYNPPRPRVVGPSKAQSEDHGRELIPIQPRLPSQNVTSASDSLPCDELEARYFRLFHEELAFDLSGYSDGPFWKRIIPQQCHHEPAIKHAILALTALYKSALLSKTHVVNSNDEHFKFALVQQSHAITSLRETLSSGRPHMRLALIACLLFSCFEGFHGNWETATQQIYSGLSILKHLSEDAGQIATSSLTDIDLEVGLTLRRLKLQILSFLAMNPMCEHPSNAPIIEEYVVDMPDQFHTLNEAFSAATNLAVAILRHSRACARSRDDPDAGQITEQEQQRLQGLLDEWNKAYEPIFLESCQQTISREYLGLLQLRICVWKCEIMNATSIANTEVIFDNFTAQFQRITHFTRYVLQKDQEIREAHGPRLQYGIGLIMALFYTATRCREFSVRREAVAILREWPCTNGVWHSLQAAKVAEWIGEIEEEGCGGMRFVPGECRVKLQTLKVTLQDVVIAVECMQYSLDGDLKPRKANLQWP